MDMLGTRREYMRHHHGKIIHFLASGVEKSSRQQKGLLYGTGHMESQASVRHTLHDDQSSWEKLKIKKQQRDAEDDLQSLHDAKQQARHQREEEKRQDLQLLQKYNPWGKPAPGAPRWTPSGALLARGNAPISRQEEKTDACREGSREHTPFGRPGGGAPLMSHDGHVDASMRVHPETRFQKHLRKEVENSLRYKGAVEGQAVQPPLTRSQSEEERASQRKCQQTRYAKRLDDQMEEVNERKKQEKIEPPLSYFPWGQSSPRRDESGKLMARRRPNGRVQSQFQSIVDQIERIGRKDHLTTHCTHPFTHGSRCQLNKARAPTENEHTTSSRPIKQSHSLPASRLEYEAEERQRRREREERKAKRNSHHALWDGGCEYRTTS